MRCAWLVGASAIAVLLIEAGIRAEENPPAQPSAETKIVQEFKAAAPHLFKGWLERWAKRLQAQDMTGHPVVNKFGAVRGWVEFSECAQEAEPMTYTIDVKKTDSIMTPFIGTLTVSIALKCTVRRAITPGTFVTKDKTSKLEAACLGHTYEECIASEAARPVPTEGMYAMHADRTFAYGGKVVTAYGWSEGKWEFSDDKAEPPLPLLEAPAATAAAIPIGRVMDGGGR